MAALTPTQIASLPGIPVPKPPDVPLVDVKTGKPTPAFYQYLTRLEEWQRRLLAALGT